MLVADYMVIMCTGVLLTENIFSPQTIGSFLLQYECDSQPILENT